jgi:hypothetical protein
MRRLSGFLLAALAANPLGAQSSQFGVRGLGIPLRPISVRAVGTGGSFGMFDPESSLNPASIGLVGNVFATFQTVQNWRRSVSPAGSVTGQDNRYPGIALAGPIGGTPLIAAFSVSGYTDRNFALASRDTLILRGEPVEAFDTLTSQGGLSDLRAAVAWRHSSAVQLGLALHMLTGSNRLDSRRFFGDSAYVGARERATVSYLGFGLSAGVMARVGRSVTLSGLVRFDDKVKVERDTASLGNTDLPITVAGGLRVQVTERLLLAGSGLYRNWSVADANLVAQGGIGSANITEWSGGVEFLRDPRRPNSLPLRLGVRHGRLPFPVQRGVDVNETGISLGTSVRFVNDRAGIDLAVERIWRKGGPSFTETATLLTVGFSIRP